MSELKKLRKSLHIIAERSGQEEKTSGLILESLSEHCNPDKVVTNLGGYGIAALFDSREAGPCVLVRCELDALPIPETIDIPYASNTTGVSHKCGHDGHMAILVGLGRRLGDSRLKKGSAILLFQPSEENGSGAGLVLDDPAFHQFKPDHAIALHNLPGYPLGSVVVGKGVFASASCGLIIRMHGSTSHAAQPESGKSPELAVASLINDLSSMPQFHTSLHEAAKVTVIHARLGEVAFGTSPGEAEVMATLRAHKQETIDRLLKLASSMAVQVGDRYGLEIETEITDPFPSTENDPAVVDVIGRSATELDLRIGQLETPFAWSEDFGHFTSRYGGALFGLGSGLDSPPLHHPEYDFPDDLIGIGVNLLHRITERLVAE